MLDAVGRSAHPLVLVLGGRHRGWMGLAALAGLWACRQPNPEWLGPAGDPTASDPTAADPTAADPTAAESGVDPTESEASTGAPDPTGPSPDQCAPEPVLGVGDCPAECTSCDGGRCLVDCGALDCRNDSVACPDGWPCDFVCGADMACKGADLHCNADRDCTVDCQGKGACQNATVVCGSGTCVVTCGSQTDACRSLDVACGPADTRVICASASNVAVEPLDASACACEALGCD